MYRFDDYNIAEQSASTKSNAPLLACKVRYPYYTPIFVMF